MVILQNTKPKITQPKISVKLNFLSSNEMPMKLKKLLQKTTYFNFCAI